MMLIARTGTVEREICPRECDHKHLLGHGGGVAHLLIISSAWHEGSEQ